MKRTTTHQGHEKKRRCVKDKEIRQASTPSRKNKRKLQGSKLKKRRNRKKLNTHETEECSKEFQYQRQC